MRAEISDSTRQQAIAYVDAVVGRAEGAPVTTADVLVETQASARPLLVRLLPGPVKRGIVRFLHFLLRHPFDHLSQPLEIRLETQIGQARGAAQAAVRRAEQTAAVVERLRAEVQAATARQAAAEEGLRLDRLFGGDVSEFEERFRGSRESVRERLAVYVDEVAAAAGDDPVADLGAGRGEWLELLRERNVEAYGVETRDDLVTAGQQRDLDLRAGDAVEHLQGVAPGSLGAVTGFQLVEHLPIARVAELVDAARKALRPGGLLVLETPDPRNLRVGAASFHLDPSHVRPLHPELLEFLVTSRGFTGAEVRELNPDEHGPRDYAVVAHR